MQFGTFSSAVFAAALLASPAAAVTISASGTGSDSEDYAFSFTGLPAPTGPGTLTVAVFGDFSDRGGRFSEFASLTFDTAPGLFEFNNFDDVNVGILTDTIAGLSLTSSLLTGGGNNVGIALEFSVSQGLLQSVLGDGAFTLFINLSDDVNNANTAAFVLTYPEIDPIPLPATLPLLAGALGFMGWRARRRAKTA